MSKENFEVLRKEIDDDYDNRLKEYCDRCKKSRDDYIGKAFQLLDNLYHKYQGEQLGLHYDKNGNRWASATFKLPVLGVTEATLKFFNGPDGGVFILNFKKDELEGSAAIPHAVELNAMTEFVVEKIRQAKAK